MKPEKSSDMRELVAAVAGPRGWTETRESWLARAGRTVGVSYRTARSIFYGEITDPEHKAVRRFKDAAELKAKREAASLAVRFEAIAGGMSAADQDFYSADITALLDAARALRGLDRARNGDGEG